MYLFISFLLLAFLMLAFLMLAFLHDDQENAQPVGEHSKIMTLVTLCGLKVVDGGYARSLHASDELLKSLQGERTAIISINVHGRAYDGLFFDDLLGKRYWVTPEIFWAGLPEWMLPSGPNITSPWKGVRHMLAQSDHKDGLPNGGHPVIIVFAQ